MLKLILGFREKIKMFWLNFFFHFNKRDLDVEVSTQFENMCAMHE